jgi:hypothetical protein
MSLSHPRVGAATGAGWATCHSRQAALARNLAIVAAIVTLIGLQLPLIGRKVTQSQKDTTEVR